MVQKHSQSRAAASAAILLLAVTLAACADTPSGLSTETALDPRLVRQVEAMGFRSDMIEDYGNHVVVEGDIRISKTQLRMVPLVDSNDPLRPSFQYRSNNLATSGNVHDIRVNLSQIAAYPEWQAAAREAFTHWSGVAGSHIRMVEGTPADITVTATRLSNCYKVAEANFPQSGNVGNSIEINTCYWQTLSHSEKVFNMVHELGHTLGFRHTNYVQQGEGGGSTGYVWIPGTPTSGGDAASVMNGGSTSPWLGFSANDVYAARTLYPAQIWPGVSYSAGTPVISWNAVNGATEYKVYHSVMKIHVAAGYDEWIESYVGSASGTSRTDPTRTYTGTNWCASYTQDGFFEYYHYYRVDAVVPGGTITGHRYPADTAPAVC